ncbi:VOC family protein [Biformimicrobium ophioploci]|uniref:VOC domain-containing protein n=1 Tax=Biformimicrobium ophioploci TaxID=3036711 RepID=A0ABQ6LW53_9GAMM|nr:hypothetical protein [Microbulbifer sp. NKW57]GMG86286.1 hypothetical protein MNKW57_06070 [Microbulbifer sp. NKW57]
MTSPTLGPCTIATLASAQAAQLVDDYCSHLQCQVLECGDVSAALAAQWQCEALAGTRYWVLGNTLGRAWLRVIEDGAAQAESPCSRTGWMAMEILVEEVDGLAASLARSPFEILRAPANLELSEHIRATQVQGPGGELLYLTSIATAVPPFELPRAQCAVDHLFIPVLASSNRDSALRYYEKLANHQGISFETRVTVINQLRGYDLQQRHPLATLQLAQNTLIEIDQLSDLDAAASEYGSTPDSLGGGIAMITFEVDQLPEGADHYRHDCAPYHGRPSCMISGPDGERIELVQRDNIS